MECARALARRDAERGRRRPTPSGSTYAFRRCAGRGRRREAERRRCSTLLREADGSGSPTAGLNPWELATGNDPSKPPALPTGATPAQLAAWTVVVARAAEPRRDDHQGMSAMNCHDSITTAAPDPTHRHPPLVLPAMRRRPRRARARHSCSATRCARGRDAERRPNPLAPKPPHFAAEGEAGHLPVHGRRAEPPRAVRLQAAAREVRRQAAAGRAAQGLPRRVHQPELDAARARSSSSPSTASAGRSCRELLPHLARSSTTSRSSSRWSTDAFNHAPAQILMNTGAQQFGRPSLGAWVTYGLGSESQDLPGFVVFSTGQQGAERRQRRTGAAASCRRSTRACRSAAAGDPVLYLSNPRGRRRRRCSATRSTRSAR